MIKLFFEQNCKCDPILDDGIICLKRHDDIIDILNSGWPICSECDLELEFIKGEGNCLQ